MTTAEASQLKPGQYVMYFDIKAMVRTVRANGVTVSYWQKVGFQEEKNYVRRVSASAISHV